MEALISVSGKVYYSSKTKKIFLTRFSKRATTKDQRQNSPKALRNGQNGTLGHYNLSLYQADAARSAGCCRFRDARDCLEKITGWSFWQIIEIIFAIYERPQSKGVKKYKFKIKKENERCLEYLVEDLDHEDENIKFTIPLAFQVLLRYINIAKCTTVRTERRTGWCFKALLKSSSW